MLQFPKYYIFIFVGLSVLTAYGIHHHQMKVAGSEAGLANRFPDSTDFSTEPSSVISDSSLAAESEQQGLVDLSSADGTKENFEDLSSCSPEKSRWENSWNQISPLFREERSQSSTEFPRQCFTFMMRKSSEQGSSEGRKWAHCENSKSPLSADSVSPCVTKNYVNLVYNFFGDVSDCLETPQRAQLPEIFALSGGHINALGAQLEAGLAQMGSVALAKANQQFSQFQKQILESKKQSCQRLAPAVKAMQPLDLKASARCGLISVPENPLVSVLYLNMKYLQDRAAVDEQMQSERILQRMKSLGLSEDTYDVANLQQILLTMAHASGPQTAVVILSNYLKRVEASKSTLNLDDFNFSTQFAADFSSESTEPADHPSFPQYLRQNSDKKVSQYLVRARNYADQLNQEFKEGVCAPNSFLAL